MQKSVVFVKKNLKIFENKYLKDIVKLEINVIIQGNIETIAFHNGSNYDHFITKELAEKFKKEFTCLGENTEKYRKNP